MSNINKRIERNRTKALRIFLEDWLAVDEVAGEDRPMKDGFHEIIEGYKKYNNMEKIESLDDL